ncbi:MAG: hypothetical protein EP329_27305 [Deltaproteobacteria bacterium]|nr:MAG: hypothetical protein EP329_27305 [Deltaproteobacteria bacterium]
MRTLLFLSVAAVAAACSPRGDAIKPHQPPAPVAVAPGEGETPAMVAAAFEHAAAGQGVAAVAPAKTERPTEPVDEPELTDGEDVTAFVREQNSDKYAPPPSTFRPGHVSPRTLDVSAYKALPFKGNGFVVALPSGAPLTTPAVYDGKVVVSGGFRSKELYALDAATGKLVWGLDLDDDGPSAPACAEGVCAFNTESCTLFVVDAATGAQRWSLWLGDPLTSAPTIADGRVFTSYPAGGVGYVPQLPNDGNHQINPAPGPGSGANGAPDAPNGQGDPAAVVAQGAQQAPGNVAHNPAAGAASRGDGKARPPGATHALAAFDLKTGKILWQVWIDSDVLSAPVAVGRHLYATSFAGTLYKLDQATGAILAARKVRATSAPVIAATGDLFYTRRDDAKGEAAAEVVVRTNDKGQAKWVAAKKRAAYLDHAVQARSGLKAQAADNDSANGFGGGAPTAANPGAALGNVGQDNVFSMQAFQGSRVLATRWGNVNTMGDEVVCTDPATGEKRWTKKLEGDLAKAGGFLAAPPAEAGGRIVLGTLDGMVLVLDPTTGKEQLRYRLQRPIRSQPVVVGGWIYVGTDDGHVAGIDTRNPELTGWSQWGGDAARTGAPRG